MCQTMSDAHSVTPISSPADEPFLEWPHPCFPNKPSLKRIGFSTEMRRLTYPSFCKLHWGCLIFSHKTWTPESPKAFSPMYSLVREQWELRTNARSSQHADVRQQLTNLACRGDRVSAISHASVPCARRLNLLLLPPLKSAPQLHRALSHPFPIWWDNSY